MIFTIHTENVITGTPATFEYEYQPELIPTGETADQMCKIAPQMISPYEAAARWATENASRFFDHIILDVACDS